MFVENYSSRCYTSRLQIFYMRSVRVMLVCMCLILQMKLNKFSLAYDLETKHCEKLMGFFTSYPKDVMSVFNYCVGGLYVCFIVGA